MHPLNSLNQNNSRGAKIGARIKLQKRTCGETEFIHTPVFTLNLYLKSYQPKKWLFHGKNENSHLTF